VSLEHRRKFLQILQTKAVGLDRRIGARVALSIHEGSLKRRKIMSNVTQTNTSVVNGVDRDKLFGTIDAIKAKPELAKFRFTIGNQWVDGPHTRSTIKTFFGAGTNFEHGVQFELNTDEPPVLLGSDHSPNPGEYLLHALAACVTSAIVYHAAARGIAIEEIESSVDGDVDLRGFLGLDKNVRNGYQEIRMKLRIKADVTDEQLHELSLLGQQYSPMLDSIRNGVPIKVAAERLE
jgi:uncharacterized OsmC-like protein